MVTMSERYNIIHRFDPRKLLLEAIGYKGAFYPGIYIPGMIRKPSGPHAEDYDKIRQGVAPDTHISTGTPIRKQDALGRWHFMPVMIVAQGKTIELPTAVISLRGKKTIVETALPGAKGSVTELISIDDYEINITAVCVGGDGNYPEDGVRGLRELYELCEPVELISAVSDIVLGTERRIIIKSLDVPEVGAVENMQVIKLTAKSNTDFELIIDDAGA